MWKLVQTEERKKEKYFVCSLDHTLYNYLVLKEINLWNVSMKYWEVSVIRKLRACQITRIFAQSL